MRSALCLAFLGAVDFACAGSAPHEPASTTAQDAAPAPAEPRSAASVAAVADLEVAFKDAIARVGPAVVSIYSTKTVAVRRPMTPFPDPLFERFFELPPESFEQHGLGSGFIIDTDGHVLTNNHVVDGAQGVRVKLADGRELDATIVGTDPPTDLALLKLAGDNLPVVDLGDSDGLQAGDWVLAIGSPLGLSQTVSAGIVSAVARANVGILDYEDFIQTDAAVNLGNSGGPLVDLDGRVIGINTAIASHSGGNMGIAFAVPVNMAKHVVEQLRTSGRVSRGQLGVIISELSPALAASFDYSGKGILVQDVRPGSAAARAGVQNGDIITALDGKPVVEVARFRNQIARSKPGTSVALGLWRSGKAITLSVPVDALEDKAVRSRSAATPSTLGLVLEDATPQRRQQLGIDDERAVVIARVEPGSSAARAGLRVGDVLESIGDAPVRDAASAAATLRSTTGALRLRVRRGDHGQFVLLERK